MKRYLPTMLALLFLFVFVFSVAATVTGDVTAKTYKCLACCTRPADDNCTALYGQFITGVGCTCHAYLCPPGCTYKCPVCF